MSDNTPADHKSPQDDGDEQVSINARDVLAGRWDDVRMGVANE